MNNEIEETLKNINDEEFCCKYTKNRSFLVTFKGEKIADFKIGLENDDSKTREKFYYHINYFWKNFDTKQYISEHKYNIVSNCERQYKIIENPIDKLEEDADNIESHLFLLSTAFQPEQEKLYS